MRSLLLTIAALLAGCASDQVAGGTSSTGNTLTVRVLDAHGEPRAGDTVFLRNAAPSFDVASAVARIADKDGTVRISGLQGGSWAVEARSDSDGAFQEITLAAGEERTLPLWPRPYGSISGRILLPDSVRSGRAILAGTNAGVALDDSGGFRFERVSPGIRTVLATPRIDGSLGEARWAAFELAPGSRRALETARPRLVRSEAWTLVWSDAFDSLRSGSWNIDTGDGCPELCGWGNGSLQSFDAAHAVARDGRLVLRAERTPSGWRSGSVQTRARAEFQYGRVEFVARLPGAKGAWSLLSLQGDSTPGPSWPEAGALDVAGLWGHQPDSLMGIAHRSGSDGSGVHVGAVLPSPSGWDGRDATFAIEWSPTEIVWTADGIVFHRVSGGPPFDHPFYLALRLGVGGDGNAAPDTGQAPFEMSIDEVRVFRRTP